MLSEFDKMIGKFRIMDLIGFLAALVLVGFGLYFMAEPEAAVKATYHLHDVLPYVMGGRYMFFAGLLAFVLVRRDHLMTAVLLLGFACLGAFDAILYLGFNPIPHALVGAIALAASLYYFRLSKEVQS